MSQNKAFVLIIANHSNNYLSNLLASESIFDKAAKLFIHQFLIYGALPLALILFVLIGTRLLQFRSSSAHWRRDWPLFSLIFYFCVLPLFIMITFNEYRGAAPYKIIGSGLLIVGALLSLSLSQPRSRLFALQIAVISIMFILALGRYQLYPQQYWAILTPILRQWAAIAPLVSGGALLLVISIPALLQLLPKEPSIT